MEPITDSKLNPERLFPADPKLRGVTRELYQEVKDLPLISPHGHTDPQWFASNQNFTNATELFLIPDHYLFRMLFSQGISLESLGISRLDGAPIEKDHRKIWQTLADHFYLFRGTPSRIWFEHALHEVLGIELPFNPENADVIYDEINEKLSQESFRPRALFDRFNLEVLATTESPLDELVHHRSIADSGWNGRVITAGYLNALMQRRTFFKSMGATSTDHGHPSAVTANLEPGECETLYTEALKKGLSGKKAEMFRGQMLTEMARMSLEDGLVMQIHPGSFRNHNQTLFQRFGRDMGADIPTQTDYVHALQPLLNRFGNEPELSVILFTLDETSYSRELAPLAGHYPILKLGPPWWFFDSPEGMLRFRRETTETAGFYNTVGFNDDTRAFLSIPARHDMARRIDCRFLAELVCEHRLSEEEAHETAIDLAYRLVKKAYRL